MAKIKLKKSQIIKYNNDTIRTYSKKSIKFKINLFIVILVNLFILSIIIYFKQLLIIPIHLYFIIGFYFDKRYNEYYLNEIIVNIKENFLKINILNDEFILNEEDIKCIRMLDEAYFYFHKSYISIYIPYDSLTDEETRIMNKLFKKYNDGYRKT